MLDYWFESIYLEPHRELFELIQADIDSASQLLLEEKVPNGRF